MKNKNNTIYFIFGFFAFIGLFFVALGILLFFSLSIDEEDRVYTTAIIERIDSYTDSDGDTSYNVFVSYDVNGKEYIEELHYHTSSYYEGKEIEVFYDKNKPSKVRVEGFEFGFLVFSGVGLIFVIIGLSGIISGVLKTKNAKKLRETGRVIEAEYVTTLVNGSYEVNGENPYNIVCKWYDSMTNQTYEFKSDNLWYNPEGFIVEHNITKFKVYIDPNNYKKYTVDTSYIENSFKSN